jgi:hypothetical protein
VPVLGGDKPLLVRSELGEVGVERPDPANLFSKKATRAINYPSCHADGAAAESALITA